MTIRSGSDNVFILYNDQLRIPPITTILKARNVFCGVTEKGTIIPKVAATISSINVGIIRTYKMSTRSVSSIEDDILMT